jgi:hypothetical protein
MKKIVLLCLALTAGYAASAQQKGKTAYMSVTIYRSGARLSDMIITRSDSAQERRDIKVKLPAFAAGATAVAVIDDNLMKLMTPWFNSGWKLLTFSDLADKDAFTDTYRFYLSKEE